MWRYIQYFSELSSDFCMVSLTCSSVLFSVLVSVKMIVKQKLSRYYFLYIGFYNPGTCYWLWSLFENLWPF